MLIFLILAESLEDTDSGADERKALREKALTASYDEYKELMLIWRSLDTKAQGNITIAGIFIAAAFAYLGKLDAHPALYEKVGFVFAMLFLVISVILSILALQIREAPQPTMGRDMRRMIVNLQGQAGQNLDEYLPRFYFEHAESWASTSNALVTSNKEKGDCLLASQIFIIMAVIGAASLAILKILL